MTTFVNPTEEFDELVGFFETSADEGGTTLDAEMCRIFANGIADLAEKFDALVGYARATGLVETLELAEARTPIARRALAQAIAAEARGSTVVVLPTRLHAPAFQSGGSAA